MKYLKFILAAFFLTGSMSCNSSNKREEATPMASIVEDTATTEATAPAEKTEFDEQEEGLSGNILRRTGRKLRTGLREEVHHAQGQTDLKR